MFSDPVENETYLNCSKAERAICLKFFSRWGLREQDEFLRDLVSNISTQQHLNLNDFLKPLVQRDFIGVLPQMGLNHIAEQILYYLDVKSLMAAEMVSSQWKTFIEEAKIWKKLTETKVREDAKWCHVWKKVGCTHCFSNTQHIKCAQPGLYYRTLFLQINTYLRNLENNWCAGNYNLYRVTFGAVNMSGVYCIRFDGDKIISGLGRCTVEIWNRETMKCIGRLPGHLGVTLCIQYDDTFIATGSSDTKVRVWNAKTFEAITVLAYHTNGVMNIRFDKVKMVTCSKDQTIAVWDIISPTEISFRLSLFGHKASVNAVEFDHKFLVSASGDKTLRIWSVDNFDVVRILKGHTRSIACMQYRQNLIVTGSSDRTIRLWDVEVGVCMRVFEGHRNTVRCLQFDSNHLVSGCDDGTIKVWDLKRAVTESVSQRNFCMDTLLGHTNAIYRIQIDDFCVTSSAYDGSTLTWDFLGLPVGVII